MNDLSALYDKRTIFVQQRKKLLDTAIRADRLLTADEEAENERLRVEIAKMDQLIDHARSIPEGGPMRGTDVELGSFQVERGQRAEWRGAPATEHRSLSSFVKDVAEKRTMNMTAGGAGGFLIPEQLIKQVLMVSPESAAIGPRATTIPPFEAAPDAATEIPSLDQSGANGILGGIQLGWLAEGGTKPEVEPELKQVKLEPQEVAGHVPITDKLLRNGGAELDTFLRRVLGNALAAEEERTFINGTGVGQPLGILNAPAMLPVARGGAGAIAYADLVNMIAVFGPDAWNGGFWLASQTALTQLLTMTDPGAAGTLLIRPSELQAGKPPSLLGLPLLISTRTPVLGATGDLMLLNASYYLKKLGFGPSIEISNGPRFTQNQSIIKIFGNVDGQPWLTTPVLMEDGVTQLSPFVVLAA